MEFESQILSDDDSSLSGQEDQVQRMIKELDNKKKTQRRKNENTEGTRGDMEMSSDSDNDVANVQPSQEKEKDEKTLRIEEAIK